jgi:hypothetical protein
MRKENVGPAKAGQRSQIGLLPNAAERRGL